MKGRLDGRTNRLRNFKILVSAYYTAMTFSHFHIKRSWNLRYVGWNEKFEILQLSGMLCWWNLYVMRLSGTIDGVWIGDWIDWPHSRLMTTLSYSIIADLHACKSLEHRDQCSRSVTVSTNRLLVKASNNGYSSTSRLNFSLNGDSLPTVYFSTNCPPYNSSTWTTVETPFHNSTSTVACVSFAAGTCLQAVA
jgi:hypothetical protein